MVKNKKRFIDKRTATRYTLTPKQLNAIDEDESENDERPTKKITSEELAARIEEQQKYGIYFNDGYNYMKHLREVSYTGGSLQPSYEFRVGQSASDFVLETQSVLSGAAGRSRHAPGSMQGGISPRAFSDAASVAAMLEAAFGAEADATDVDPDIAEALEGQVDLEDPENVLDDDFVIQAKGIVEEDADDFPGLEEDDDDEDSKNYVDPTKSMDKGKLVGAWIQHQDFEDEEDDEELVDESGETKIRPKTKEQKKMTAAMIKDWVRSENLKAGKDEQDDEDFQEDKRSRFSNYSMTSSVMRRTEGLRLLDDRFEKMMEQYDEEEIGGLDLEDHEQGGGEVQSKTLKKILGDKQGENDAYEAMTLEAPSEPDPVAMRFQYEDDEEGADKKEKIVLEFSDDRFDCQSVASLRTNRSFQPRILEPPRATTKIILDKRTGIPQGVLGKAYKSEESGSDDNSDTGSDILSLISSLSVARPKDETPEERKLRKQTLKDLRRQRRVEKKSCRKAFKDEKTKQEKEVANVQRRLKTISMV
ncbi:hypothetical protein RvY_16654 [Ramazzottius varieornatus]|uniref:Protein LTV1 homolog n=1 Tax=Ramazzottius varieornatus TaxID=947166 RepID=A0A1D1W6N0_RAMVA|nr:hypothetical protein RvY_16654 [Ramazzottius varieornatus]